MRASDRGGCKVLLFPTPTAPADLSDLKAGIAEELTDIAHRATHLGAEVLRRLLRGQQQSQELALTVEEVAQAEAADPAIGALCALGRHALEVVDLLDLQIHEAADPEDGGAG